jgi:hypothetical protein
LWLHAHVELWLQKVLLLVICLLSGCSGKLGVQVLLEQLLLMLVLLVLLLLALLEEAVVLVGVGLVGHELARDKCVLVECR